jgi:membrane protease YdiL (CAAX protease family)
VERLYSFCWLWVVLAEGGKMEKTIISGPEESCANDRWSGVEGSKAGRIVELVLVLIVGLGQPILASIYYVLGGIGSTDPLQQQFRIWSALVAETSSLALLGYVIARRGKKWQDLGWGFKSKDIAVAAGLFVAAYIGASVSVVVAQYAYHAYTGHFRTVSPMHLGLGLSVASIALVCLNPFFEELTVRAFTMSEVLALGGTPSLAIAVSVALQVSYHLYQGMLGVVALTIIFTVFALYYARTRRIAPVVVAHFMYDVLLLVKDQ